MDASPLSLLAPLADLGLDGTRVEHVEGDDQQQPGASSSSPCPWKGIEAPCDIRGTWLPAFPAHTPLFAMAVRLRQYAGLSQLPLSLARFSRKDNSHL